MFTAETVPALKWGDCNEEGLVSFLVGEKNFSEERVRSAIRKLNANKGKSSQGTAMPRDLCGISVVILNQLFTSRIIGLCGKKAVA